MIIKVGMECTEVLSKIGAVTFIESHKDSAPVHEIDSYVEKTYSPPVISQALSDPANSYHIINYEGKIAGFSKMGLNRKHPSVIGGANAKMDQIYLLSSFYGLKLGAKLLQFNIDLSKAYNQSGIWLVVWTGNHQAINFYKRFGFSIVKDDVFHLTESHISPCHIMYLKF